MNTIRAGSARGPFEQKAGIAIAHVKFENHYYYALTKNLTHEPAAGRVQSASGQHPIISAAVFNGDTRDCDII